MFPPFGIIQLRKSLGPWLLVIIRLAKPTYIQNHVCCRGEIGVICQDVKSLKEKFDNRVSLSKYLSIEQTSFRMASSTSSGKSITSDSTSGAMTSSTSSVNIVSDTATGYIMASSETSGRMSPAPSVECQTPKSNVEDVAVQHGATPGKVLSDEDWVLFDA